MVSSAAVLDRYRVTHEDESGWVDFEREQLPAPMPAAPWVEKVDEDLLVSVNPVVVALRARIASSYDPHRDYFSGYVAQADSTPELTDAANRSVAESADE